LPDCHEPHTARGYCHRHYRAFLRAGAEKIEIERRYGLTDEERFWSYVEKKQGCWEWTGYKNEKGYGVINLRGERALAHRFAWQLDEPIPPGMSILHRCDNPACVRRKHLFLGTRADNNADMDAKGRRRAPDMHGTKNHRAQLTEDDVRAIRASPERGPVLAARYGVANAHIWAIRRRTFWKHIE
jgi:hypothetical protein